MEGAKMATNRSAIRELRPAESLRSRVENSIASAIISGELAPGTIVSVPTLAGQFAVSATPVREAMLDLANRGFVESVRNKGFRITKVGAHDLDELVQIRRWLEAPAMHIVAEHLRGTSLSSYQLQAARIVTAATSSPPDFEDYLQADSMFHSSLLRLVGNSRLVELVGDLRQQTRMVGLTHLSQSIELKKSALEHHELLNLLGEGNGEAAEKLMVRHVGHAIGWWAGFAESEDPEESSIT